MADDVLSAQAALVPVPLAAAQSTAKVNNFSNRAKACVTIVHQLTGEYPWNLVPLCRDTNWSISLFNPKSMEERQV